ncbi:MAG TPA: hypothetical protein VGW34_10635 [Allosphingosinicella sp.]|nr:hypothetical protein [Allosphingosinicella sp.]
MTPVILPRRPHRTAIMLPWNTAAGRIPESREGPYLVTHDGGCGATFRSLAAAEAVRDHLLGLGYDDAAIAAAANDNAARTRAAERERELIALRLASPKRAGGGRPLVGQADAAHLPLFVAADEPRLF